MIYQPTKYSLLRNRGMIFMPQKLNARFVQVDHCFFEIPINKREKGKVYDLLSDKMLLAEKQRDYTHALLKLIHCFFESRRNKEIVERVKITWSFKWQNAKSLAERRSYDFYARNDFLTVIYPRMFLTCGLRKITSSFFPAQKARKNSLLSLWGVWKELLVTLHQRHLNL